MSNIKDVLIVADVPFDYVQQSEEDGGLPDAEIAIIASALLPPAIGLRYSYTDLGYLPNDRGGQTSMFRLVIEGHEALSWQFLGRLAMALKTSDKLAKLHIAEATDIEDGEGRWTHVVPESELSGEAIVVNNPRRQMP